jgi:catechol 2,3-dioxygenase-like lactoylglutathione lyase family enzyme
MADERPVLDQVNFVVRDMEASAAFYARLGVQLDARDPAWAPHHRNGRKTAGAQVDLDSTAFAPAWDAGWPSGTTGVVLGFRLPSREAVDALYAELVGAGHRSQQEPWDAFFGARFAVVEDPDGNAVALMSTPDPAHRSPVDPPPS